MKAIFCTLVLSVGLLFASSAVAQMDPTQDPKEDPTLDSTVDELTDEQASVMETEGDDDFLSGEEKAEIEAPVVEENTGRAEAPGTPLFLVGARFRWLAMPRWLIEGFGVNIKSKKDSAFLISSVGAGPEFTYRKDDFDITASIWFLGLGWDGNVSFKEDGASDNSWEVVTNDLKTILITADFIWSHPFTDWLALTYGVGLGLGIPIGQIVRNEASRDSNHLLPCEGPGAEDCGTGDDEQYDEIYDTLKVIPWINVLAGLRFKPHRHLAVYVDTGFGLGFLAGVRAGYIF